MPTLVEASCVQATTTSLVFVLPMNRLGPKGVPSDAKKLLGLPARVLVRVKAGGLPYDVSQLLEMESRLSLAVFVLTWKPMLPFPVRKVESG